MNKKQKDYIFNVNWEDRFKNIHKVGLLAQIDDIYYFLMRDRRNAENAYKTGFIGISGFDAGKIYKSQELFDFFKSRVLNKKDMNPCEELAESKGISMIDSFSVEQVSERIAHKYKEAILKAYEIQEKREQLQENSNGNKEVGTTNTQTDGLHSL